MTDDHAPTRLRAYAETVLEFQEPSPLSIDLRVPLMTSTRRALDAIGLDAPFAVLTAENPGGEHVEDVGSPQREERAERRNAALTTRLEGELRARGLAYHRVDGMAPDGSYRERCVATSIGREDAVELARRFDQLALFWYDGERFWLLPAEATGAPRPLPG